MDPAIAAKPFVQGILVRVAWEHLEPAPGAYAWSLIDGQIASARAFGKRITLAIGCGIGIPQWLFSSGAARLESLAPRRDTIAVPWDTLFLARWESLIRAAGARYRCDSTIAMVYMTHSSANGYEMQLPAVTVPALDDAGYSDAAMIASWKRVVDAFAAAFPGHLLTNDAHPVKGSNAVADSVAAYARTALGLRYGVSAWWWTQRNTAVYPAQYALLRASAAGGFAGVQMAYNGTSDSGMFGAGGMPEALQLAIRDGICYWEIWNQDILNPAFDSLLAHAACATAGAAAPRDDRTDASVYPNPCRGALTVSIRGTDACDVAVFSALGARVYAGTAAGLRGAGGAGGMTMVIDASRWPPGAYLLRIAPSGGPVQCRTVLRAR